MYEIVYRSMYNKRYIKEYAFTRFARKRVFYLAQDGCYGIIKVTKLRNCRLNFEKCWKRTSFILGEQTYNEIGKRENSKNGN